MKTLLASSDQALVSRWHTGIAALGEGVVARSLTELADELQRGKPDVILLDRLLPGVGISSHLLTLVGDVSPVPVVLMVAVPNETEGLRLLGSGVRGYCNRYMAPDKIEAMVQAVQKGEIWAGRRIMTLLIDRLMRSSLAVELEEPPEELLQRFRSLTSREVQVVEQVLAGKTNAEISQVLHIAERTVKTHVGSALRKMQVKDRLQLALKVKELMTLRDRNRAR
jgi:DNA-binding NarL/FixJ family response regulator